MTDNNPYIFDLILKDLKIESWIDFKSKKVVLKLFKPLTGLDYKIYVLHTNNKVLYVGTTKRSIKNRLNGGLNADGKNGYHGYKWKNLNTIKILIWNFKDLDKEKIENIEAELVYIIRKETGRWPELQNEIHFNNHYQNTGNSLAILMYKQITNING
ncbi:GIY-YIG nuclease family protein [Flavobacterium sp. CFBP9031]|uniref:GIY-YIG nuclease family protein n=1 Tax=Flavobacterium sp. CFBP9031 TaxID=3096538 RepID=UPI002A6B0601|nr:GIY-YIG nuclease family protein [Flavobacterium sp. CFBP9031]MDY0987070.1 GIY-YIG nuclease family protein [Flavobacterium sp. CFBP9031]